MNFAGCLLFCAATLAQVSAPAIVAHRGAMHDTPENTMAAFERAVELGADIVEVDVRTSADGHLYVIHDSTVNRTTDGEGPGSDLTMAELQALDAGSWFDASFAGLRIPSLAEVLEWGKGRTTILLDLKESGPDFADAVADTVRAHGDPEAVVIGVRSPMQAREFRARLPESRQLAFMRSPDLIEEFAEEGVEVLRLWLRWIHADADLPGRVRATGKKLMINGSTGGLDETRAIMRHAPDWILIDDVPQLAASLKALE